MIHTVNKPFALRTAKRIMMTALPVLHTYNMDFFRNESIKGPVNIPNVNGTSLDKRDHPDQYFASGQIEH